MEILGKLASNYTSKIKILPSVSKDISIRFAEQCLRIINHNYQLNGLKGSTKIQNME